MGSSEDATPTLWLASKSPRRAELMQQVGLDFKVLEGVDVDESVREGESPARYVGRIVRAKVEAATAECRRRFAAGAPWVVLVADTTVALDDVILGKPVNVDEARDMLRALSDRTHQVMTGVAVAGAQQTQTLMHLSHVTFRALESDEIRRYTESREPYDKAGGYGIQGPAAAFVSRLEGTQASVMGLPVCQTIELLRQFGIRPVR
jgi:septum formation protein